MNMKSLKYTTAALNDMMDALKDLVFPEYAELSKEAATEIIRRSLSILAGNEIAEQFIEGIPEISRLMGTDVAAIKANDPAATDLQEVIFCYPAVKAILYYRTAHLLWNLKVRILPRMLTEFAHSATGIDIHPGAQIGAYFAIDHGTGTVIGETTIIGEHVTLYQGVTLGAKNFCYDKDGCPINIPRHPILEDWVTVYSNASLLGRITIGESSVIGGNVWLTHSVPAGSRILQGHHLDQISKEDC
jgi:serine O-acetyltransferase